MLTQMETVQETDANAELLAPLVFAEASIPKRVSPTDLASVATAARHDDRPTKQVPPRRQAIRARISLLRKRLRRREGHGPERTHASTP